MPICTKCREEKHRLDFYCRSDNEARYPRCKACQNKAVLSAYHKKEGAFRKLHGTSSYLYKKNQPVKECKCKTLISHPGGTFCADCGRKEVA